MQEQATHWAILSALAQLIKELLQINVPKLILRNQKRGLSADFGFQNELISASSTFISTRTYRRKISAAKIGAVTYVKSLSQSHVELDLLGEQLVPF